MTMETKFVNLVPLNGTNYATRKIQCKMALIRDGLWDIVNMTESVPDSRTETALHAKYLSRRDRELGNNCFIGGTLLKHKGVFGKLIEWKAMVEKSSGKRVKTDNGGRIHFNTLPKTPEQTGVAEWMNRILVETVRAMLSDSKLPKKFWAEALSPAAYVRNRSPITAVEGMTPYEAWKGYKPNVSHFRIFGCGAYVHIPKDERSKIDPKAKKSIFIGYGIGVKGYRLYDTSKARVIHARDVIFDEFQLQAEIHYQDSSWWTWWKVTRNNRTTKITKRYENSTTIWWMGLQCS